MISLPIILDSLAVAVQLFAAYLGYKIYKFNRLSSGWVFIILSFVVQALRRVMQMYFDFIGVIVNTILDRSFMLLISILLLFGLFAVLKNFENFDVVKSDVKSKIHRSSFRK